MKIVGFMHVFSLGSTLYISTHLVTEQKLTGFGAKIGFKITLLWFHIKWALKSHLRSWSYADFINFCPLIPKLYIYLVPSHQNWAITAKKIVNFDIKYVVQSDLFWVKFWFEVLDLHRMYRFWLKWPKLVTWFHTSNLIIFVVLPTITKTPRKLWIKLAMNNR